MVLSKSAGCIKNSMIRKMFNKSLAYENVISFALGEPDFTASDNVAKAGCEAIREGRTRYSANAGILPLRAAVSERLQKDLGLYYNPDTEISVTTGAMEALFLTLRSLLDPGDQVIIFEPYWANYVQQVQICGGEPVGVLCREENSFMPDPEAMRNAVTGRTKVIIINSPCNPTGAVFDETILESIAGLAQKHDITVISDEVYRTIVFDGTICRSIAEFPGMKERSIVINSFSKSYAMTGWRIGYAAGPETVINCVTKLQEDVAACAATPCQYAALEAIRGSQAYNAYMVEKYAERRETLVKGLNEIPGISCRLAGGTFYAFASVKELGVSSEYFADRLLEEKQVVVIPGTAFGTGGEGFVRISFATGMEKIEKGLKLIAEFVREL